MPLFRFGFHAMAAENELQLWADHDGHARAVAEAAIGDALRIEAKYSRYLDDSVTTRINRAAGGREVEIDAETSALLRYADACHRLSGGAFDITSGVLRRAWDFRRTTPRLPEDSEIADAMALIGWTRVEWSDGTMRLPSRGMEIDFGGIGKEYAADRMATICLEHGAKHALINLGGDVRATGPQRDGAPWRVGIVHPRKKGSVVAGIELREGAIATSGDYERFFEVGGRRYCHLLNAKTGRPASYWQSVSVVAPVCVFAGSCATIAVLLEGAAEAFLEAQIVPYLAVDMHGGLHGAFKIHAV
jgi:thiamine biosynthesis lipoprotein